MFEDMFGIDRFTRWMFGVVIMILIVVFSSLAISAEEDNQENTDTKIEANGNEAGSR